MSMFNRQFVYRKEAEEGQDGGGGSAEEEIKSSEGESGEPEVSAEIIAKAEKMGWTPRESFKGDPSKWRPADEFVERGENMLPLLRAQSKRQEREIADLKAGMKELAEYHSKTEQRAYAKALQDLREQRAAAIAAGDGAAFDKVDGEIDKLKKDLETKTQPAQKQNDDDPVFQEWLSRNKWAEDEEMQLVGEAIAKSLIKKGEKATGVDLLEMVTKEVKRRYPEKFENPRRNAAPSVEGGSGPRKGGGKTFADMPAEARAACERMAKNGYSGKPEEMAKFKAEYVKNFFSEA